MEGNVLAIFRLNLVFQVWFQFQVLEITRLAKSSTAEQQFDHCNFTIEAQTKPKKVECGSFMGSKFKL